MPIIYTTEPTMEEAERVIAQANEEHAEYLRKKALEPVPSEQHVNCIDPDCDCYSACDCDCHLCEPDEICDCECYCPDEEEE
jgi:hypothetical protein